MFQHLLVTLDGSQIAEQALAPALALADKFGSRLTLLRVAVTPQMQLAEWTLGLPDSADLYKQLSHAARMEASAYLEGWCDSLRAKGYEVNPQVVEGHRVAHAIVDASDDLGTDVIVMCTHGRSGLQRWVLGSVAENVMRHAGVPVMLIRATAVEEEA